LISINGGRGRRPAKTKAKPTFAQAFQVFVDKMQSEGRGYARKLGFKGPNFHQQVEDEISWWENVKGMDYFKWDVPPATPNWRRVRALHGIEVALDVCPHSGVGGIEDWIELIDEYAVQMRRYAPLAPAGPPREEMLRYSMILRIREKQKEIEARAQKEIGKIKEESATAKRRAGLNADCD
jgi:hypothetical protein